MRNKPRTAIDEIRTEVAEIFDLRSNNQYEAVDARLIEYSNQLPAVSPIFVRLRRDTGETFVLPREGDLIREGGLIREI